MPRSCLHIFNGNRSSDVTKGDALGVIAPSSRKKLPSLKKYKKTLVFLLYFNFFPAFEECYYVSILLKMYTKLLWELPWHFKISGYVSLGFHTQINISCKKCIKQGSDFTLTSDN